ncbi:lactate utilization protein [Desulfosarcina cetonica]|uniref:lactate utilization protein n=1 Tax=Desulfosarcina cetonica TaxID=90730 RepID=UPI000B150E7E|nr:lactate utilization protein [Desulfosarcina cetonica]
MENPIHEYWTIRLQRTQKALEANNFDVYIADNKDMAKKLAYETIIPTMAPKTISWGGSMTFVGTRLYEALRNDPRYTVLDTYDKSLSPEASMQRRRESLLVDLFITGTNAVTENGQLVNLDMIGNRVAALTFGPRHVLLFIGRNKLVPDREAAMARIKGYAAPVNVMRLEKKKSLRQDRPLRKLQQPRPHLQYLDDHRKKLSQAAHQDRFD